MIALVHHVQERGEPLVVWAVETQFAIDHLEANAQPRADMALHVWHLGEFGPLAPPAGQFPGIRVEEVILLDSVTVIENGLPRHLAGPIARRVNLKDNLRGDPALLPLEVGAAGA